MNEHYPQAPQNGNNGSPLQGQEEHGLDLRVYLFKFLHRWPWLVSGLLVGLCIAFLVNRYATPRYAVQADIVLKDPYKDQGSDPMNMSFTKIFSGADLEKYESELAVLNSSPILIKALGQLPGYGAEFTSIGRIASFPSYPHPPSFRIEIDSLHPQLSGLTLQLDEEADGIRIREVEGPKEGGLKVYDPFDMVLWEKTDSVQAPKAQKVSFGQWIEGTFYRFRFVATDQKSDRQACTASSFATHQPCSKHFK